MSHTNVVYNLVKLITSSGAWFLVARPVCGVIHLLLSRTVESQSQVLHNHAITNRNTDTYVVTKYDWLNIRVFIVTRLEHRIPEHQPTKQPIYPPSQPASQPASYLVWVLAQNQANKKRLKRLMGWDGVQCKIV